MGFKKGTPKPANSGRKKGSKNKRKLARVADYLLECEINPAAAILELIDRGDLTDREKVGAWVDLLSYCEAKPKFAGDPAGDDEPDADDYGDLDSGQLLKLAKGSA